MDTVWAVVGIIFGALLAVGLLMLSSTNNLRFARGLILASAALLGVWCFAWEIMTEQSDWIRWTVGFMVGAFVFVAVPEIQRRSGTVPNNTSVSAETPSVTVNENVSSHNQSGGITAHTVNK